MQKTLKNYFLFGMLAIVTFSANIEGHPDKKTSEKIHPFKQRIHGICSGHDALHMSEKEVDLMLIEVSEHFDDAYSLIEKSSSDSYLVQLTNIVRLSRLPESKKRDFYRGSYSKCLKKIEKGEEWSDAIRTLIQETSALSVDEIKRHTTSKNKYLKQAAEKALAARKKTSVFNKPSSKSTRVTNNEEQGLVYETTSKVESSRIEWVGWVFVALIVGVFLSFLEKWRRKSK